MSGFTSQWLALREPADARSRSVELVAALPAPSSAIIDLGAGTGANLRWLAPQLDYAQDWTLVDKDDELLASARTATRAWSEALGYRIHGQGDSCTITGRGFDCRVRTLELDLFGNLDDLELPAGCLVTASALLDLVSNSWLAKLVAGIASSRASVLWALSYDGSVTIDPACEHDPLIVEWVNRHQRTDKGFGPALGPDAWLVARSQLELAGHEVLVKDSSWRCLPEDRVLVGALIAGWADAASAIVPSEKSVIRRWRKQRLEQAANGELEVTVGHRDLLARPRAVPGRSA